MNRRSTIACGAIFAALPFAEMLAYARPTAATDGTTILARGASPGNTVWG